MSSEECWRSETVVPILHTEAYETATAWYERWGFHIERIHRFEPELPAFVTIARGSNRLFLSEHDGDASPDTLVYMYVPDVWDIARTFGVEVHTTPWAHEIELDDPDGNRLRIGTARS